MRLERLRRILIGLLIDPQMARRAAVHTRDSFEWLIVVEIIQNDLIDALGRIHEIEHRRIPKGGHDHARIQRVQSSLEAGVIGQHRLLVLLDFVPLADILVQFCIGCAGVEGELLRLRLVIVHRLLAFLQLFS